MLGLLSYLLCLFLLWYLCCYVNQFDAGFENSEEEVIGWIILIYEEILLGFELGVLNGVFEVQDKLD